MELREQVSSRSDDNRRSDDGDDVSGSGPKNVSFGRYTLMRRLAAGGMAEIFLAKQSGISGFERLLVVKRILPHLAANREFITMFLDEARNAAQLTHPNIVQIYDVDQVSGSYYIAMEYIHGEDVRRVYNQEVQRGSRIPFHIAAHLIAEAAHGLDHAHRKVDMSGQPLGLVHRDISPQNMLVTYDGHVKVVDFGVAKAVTNEARTRSGVLKGKYSYMSPEQAQGQKIDQRTDIFALGVVLYEVTVGERLFKRANELETLHAVIACEVPAPSKNDPSYPPQLEKIVLKALAKNPAKRYQTASELGRDLEEFTRAYGRPLSATDIASYMQELFADKLAEELLMGPRLWEEDHTNPDRKSEQQREYASKGTKLVGEGSDSELSRFDDSHPESRGDYRTQDNTHKESSGADSNSQRSGSRQSQSSWQSDSGENAHVDMSRATDALTKQGAFELMNDQPKTIASETNASQPRAILKNYTPIVWASVVALIVIGLSIAISAAGLFDTARYSGPMVLVTQPAGATVYLDGIRVSEGTTPVTIDRQLPLGPHHVEFQLTGYEGLKAVVNTTPDKMTFERELRAVSLAEPAAAAVVVEKPVVATKPPVAMKPTVLSTPAPAKADSEKDEEARGTGQVNVKSNLALKVYEGKNLLGSTPFTRSLSAGTHTLRLEHPASGWSDTRRVNITAQNTERVEVNVSQGKLRINIQPFANVKVGSVNAETPMAPLELPAGRYTVRIWNSELKRDESVQVTVTAGQEAALERNWLR